MKGYLTLAAILTAALTSCSHCGEKEIMLEPGEKIWGAFVADGKDMPFMPGHVADMRESNKGNQVQPLLLTSKGRYIWSESPFAFEVSDDKLTITAKEGEILVKDAGATLADAHAAAMADLMPPKGMIPPEEFFTKPQYNTWIELIYNQNQEDILRYARNIVGNGFPPGILMIDDTWQEDYGKWDFHPKRFPDPKSMVDELHRLGFKVMLWICPFVSMDQALICREINSFKGFLMNPEGNGMWAGSYHPYPVIWWNGTSAVLDFSNEKSVEWFKGELRRLQNDYGVDGFKFDAGDFRYYTGDGLSKYPMIPAEQCRKFAEIGLDYLYNEYRATWKMGNEPLVQRLHDKKHSWSDLGKLIPEMLAANLLGYPFSCADMIGGGDFLTFFNNEKIDQDLVVRSAQCHAFMPMMQFSVAPWRILDKRHMDAVKKSVETREKIMPYLMAAVKKAADEGTPVVCNMEFLYPGAGYETVKDQFFLGEDFLVTPMLQAGEGMRTVVLPEGKWLSDRGELLTGPTSVETDVPLERIPYFKKVE